MERFTYHQLKPGEILDKMDDLGKEIVLKYSKFFTPGANEVMIYAYDNEKKHVVGFCSCILPSGNSESYGLLPDEIYIRSLNVLRGKKVDGENYQNQGIGTRLLKEIGKYAKDNGYQRLVLDSLSEDTDMFYWGRGWISKAFDAEMIKEVDEDVWLTACIMHECMTRAIKTKTGKIKAESTRTSIGSELLKMLENKNFDNILQYMEEPTNTKHYNCVFDYFNYNYKISKFILNNKYIPHVVKELQKAIDTEHYYSSIKKYYNDCGRRTIFNGSEEEKTNVFVNNVIADVFLIERDKMIYKSKTETKKAFEKIKSETKTESKGR